MINPEDIDPTVGKFRNVIQTAIIPKSSNPKTSAATSNLLIPHSLSSPHADHSANHQQHILRPIKDDSFNLYAGVLDNPVASIRINSAPDVDLSHPPEDLVDKNAAVNAEVSVDIGGDNLPKKKYFPKEAWPGRKPTGGMAI